MTGGPTRYAALLGGALLIGVGFGLGFGTVVLAVAASVLGIAVLVWSVPRPIWLLCACLICVPLLSVGANLGIMVVSLPELLLYGSVIVGILRLLSGRSRLRWTPLHAPMLLLTLLYIVGFLRAPEWTLGAYELGSLKVLYGFLVCVALYFVVHDAVQDDRARILLVRSWLLAGALAVVLGAYYYLSGQVSFRPDFSGVSGITSPLEKAHGPFLVYIVAISLPLVAVTRRSAARWLLRALLIACLVEIGFSTQRVAWISLLIVACVYVLLSVQSSPHWAPGLRRVLIGAVLLSLLVSIGIATFLNVSQSPRAQAFMSALDVGDVSARNRSLLWGHTVQLIRAHPLEGYALGSFRRLYLMGEYQYSTVVGLGERGLAVHNTLLEVMLDLGLPGGAALLWLLWLAFAYGLRALRSSHSALQSAMALGLVLMLIHFTVWGLTDTLFIKPAQNGLIFFSALGLLTSLRDSAMQTVPSLLDRQSATIPGQGLYPAL